MRAFILVSLLVAMVGCGSDKLDDTAYRRLVDSYDTYDQCVSEGNFAPCYQTLTFCKDGRANAMFDYRQDGPYSVVEDEAIANLQTMTLHFNLAKQSSDQLPGRHPWELVEPVYYDCAK